MPTILTYSGKSQMYFRGIAIKRSNKKEMASKILTHLKILTEVSFCDIIFFTSKVSFTILKPGNFCIFQVNFNNLSE